MSQILPLMLFLSEKELFSWTYPLKKTPRWTKILTSPVWNKILKIWDTFWTHTNRSTMQQKLFQFFYHKKLKLLEITSKGTKEPLPKLKKYVDIENICSSCTAVQMVVFAKMCIYCRTTTQIFSLWRQHNTLIVQKGGIGKNNINFNTEIKT